MQEYIRRIKITVGVVAFCIPGRIYMGHLPLNELFYCLAGVFVLKDDPHTGRIYAVLMNSPLHACAQGGGGMSCVPAVLL